MFRRAACLKGGTRVAIRRPGKFETKHVHSPKEVPMNRKNMQSYQMLTRTVEFATNHVGLFPKNSAAAEILDTMKSGVSELSGKGSTRVSAESAMRISGNARTAAREELHQARARP